MTINLPATATVFTLRGATAVEHMPGWLSGIFDRPPYTPIRVQYPASMADNSITDGVRIINDLIRSTPGNIICCGHSQGAQVLSDWLRLYRDDDSAPGPGRLQFVLTGNPLRYHTGKLIGAPVVGPRGTKGVETPTDTRWNVIDVARRHDGWAIKGAWWDFRQFLGMWTDHMNYRGVDIYSPENTVTQNGNITLITTT
jgi:pimeloyl-ACP methyl ester carboxylesterase